ncbi:hypothetical protein F5Y15DRAFT_398921 [Xylariaceae sp. FL0016]|nr:hypothetical protein F5Y15DRAFT_398921 [Xylariaceae sp. FL0016]
MAFGLLLSIEGRRRKIPMLSSFMALAHLVNLSFAQNLFCLALLLTPSPLPSGDEDLELPVVPLPSSRWLQLRNTLAPPKPKNWTPHASIFFSSVILHLAAIFFLPYAAQTASFMTVALSVRTSTFLPLILPKVVPVRWGTTHKHPSSAYDLFSTVFRYTSTPSFVLYVKASLVALCTNAPDSHYHRHSIFIPWDLEKRSKWERSTTALGKVLGSASDHPVVAAVAWDVLICTLSLGLWAAVRSTDIQDMTNCAVPYASKRPVPQIESMGAADKTDSVLGDDAVLEHENSMTPRRSHRARKSRFGSVNSSASEDIASSTGSATPYTRGRRGRSKKTQQEPEEERAYEPSPTETKDLVEGDTLPPKELDWESAAFAWGVAALSGLASASAGVFGAECVSR